MEAVLVTMGAALIAMVAATFAAVLGSIYEQRREGTKTRDKLDETNETLQQPTAGPRSSRPATSTCSTTLRITAA